MAVGAGGRVPRAKLIRFADGHVDGCMNLKELLERVMRVACADQAWVEAMDMAKKLANMSFLQLPAFEKLIAAFWRLLAAYVESWGYEDAF